MGWSSSSSPSHSLSHSSTHRRTVAAEASATVPPIQYHHPPTVSACTPYPSVAGLRAQTQPGAPSSSFPRRQPPQLLVFFPLWVVGGYLCSQSVVDSTRRKRLGDRRPARSPRAGLGRVHVTARSPGSFGIAHSSSRYRVLSLCVCTIPPPPSTTLLCSTSVYHTPSVALAYGPFFFFLPFAVSSSCSLLALACSAAREEAAMDNTGREGGPGGGGGGGHLSTCRSRQVRDKVKRRVC